MVIVGHRGERAFNKVTESSFLLFAHHFLPPAMTEGFHSQLAEGSSSLAVLPFIATLVYNPLVSSLPRSFKLILQIRFHKALHNMLQWDQDILYLLYIKLARKLLHRL